MISRLQFFLAAGFFVCRLGAANIDNPVILVLGPGTVILSNYFHKDLTHFPDVCIPWEIKENGTLRAWVTARNITRTLEGPDWLNLSFVADALRPGNPGDFDNGYAGLGGVLRLPDGKYYGVYHGEDWENLIKGYWANIGTAVSEDGITFTKKGAILKPWEPKGYAASNGTMNNPLYGGAQGPTLVYSRDGRHIFCYHVDNIYSMNGISGGVVEPLSVARSKIEDKLAPGSWKKYYHSFNANFSLNSPALSSFSVDGYYSMPTNAQWLSNNFLNVSYPTVLFPPVVGVNYAYPYVHYITNSRLYLATMFLHYSPVSGIYIALSSNGLEWSTPKRVTNVPVVYPAPAGQWETVYPCFVEGAGCNSNTINGWITYGENFASTGQGHKLARFPIQILSPSPSQIFETTPSTNKAVLWSSLSETPSSGGAQFDMGVIRGWDPDSGFINGMGLEEVSVEVIELPARQQVFLKTFWAPPFLPGKVSGLKSSSYEIKISAKSAAAVGGETTLLVFNHLYSNTGSPPVAPHSLVATPASSSRLDLFFQEVENETSYEVAIGSTDKITSATKIKDLPAGSTFCSITGLPPEKKQWLWVRAINAFGPSPWSYPANAATLSGGDVSIPQDGGLAYIESATLAGLTSSGIVAGQREFGISLTNFNAVSGRISYHLTPFITAYAAATPTHTITLPSISDASAYKYMGAEVYIKHWPTFFYSNNNNGLITRLLSGSLNSSMSFMTATGSIFRIDKEINETGEWMQIFRNITNLLPRNALNQIRFLYNANASWLQTGVPHEALIANIRFYRSAALVHSVSARQTTSGDEILWEDQSGATTYSVQVSTNRIHFQTLASGISEKRYFTASQPPGNRFYRVALEVSSEPQLYSIPVPLALRPAARPQVQARAISSTEIEIFWDPGVRPPLGFHLFLNTENEIATAKKIVTIPGTQTSHRVKDLTPLTAYYLWVVRDEGAVQTASEVVRIKTTGPSPLFFKSRIAGLVGDLEVVIAANLIEEGIQNIEFYSADGRKIRAPYRIENGILYWNGLLEGGKKASLATYLLAVTTRAKTYRAAFVLAW